MPVDDKVDYLTVERSAPQDPLPSERRGRLRLRRESRLRRATTSSLVPPLYVATDALLDKIADFAQAGGHVVLTFKSGFTDEHNTVRPVRAPGPLREAAGLSYQEFSTLKTPLALKGDPFGAGDGNLVSVWADMLLPEEATPLAYYDHPFFGRYPALTRNAFGKGEVTYRGNPSLGHSPGEGAARRARARRRAREDADASRTSSPRYGPRRAKGPLLPELLGEWPSSFPIPTAAARSSSAGTRSERETA